MKNQLWYKDAVFYQISVRAFKDSNGDGHGDLRGLTEKLDYIQNLGVDCIWIMPIYPSPLRDDGYDIADYYNVSDEYGKLDDLKGLIAAAHERGIRIIMDLVLNHTSDAHPWFQASRSDRNSPFRDYYVWSNTDKKYKDVRIIFGDIEKSNWDWDEKTRQYYWHRFFSSQPDLNFDNPAVQDEMLNVVRFWLTLGIDGFRVDAPTYLFEREGTNCESLPETHAYLKRIRHLIDNEFPEAIMLAESNQWPRELSQYFSSGDEFHMAFHFPLMPRIFLSIAQNNAAPIIEILKDTPAIPDNCQWAIFLRNHDELSLEMVTDEERKLMWREFAPEPHMIHNLGIRRRLAPILNNDRSKIELVNSLLFTLPGSPIIYYGDEIGMGDNLNLPDRNGVRTPMQWNSSSNAGFTKGEPFAELVQGQYHFQHVNTESQLVNPDSLYRVIRRMVHIRKEHQAFGRGSAHFIETNDTGLLAYVREHGAEKILLIHNLGDSEKSFSLPAEYQGEYINLMNNETHNTQSVRLNPYSYHWMKKNDQ
jgi:maltose alpha-D-glucosyltransferase/alpha-amylase